ncbi:MAG: hypothetical protein HY877_04410 [Deltaproteobacteria bacterium]|nr:hypothetical protein [Deltaproteobacteria bacterium]
MSDSKMVWDAYQITEKEAGKICWNKIGVAFLNKDDSINIFLDAFPKDGKVQLRGRKPKNREE